METVKLPKSENEAVASCCIQPKDASACCTLPESTGENGGQCCEQPQDGSVCC